MHDATRDDPLDSFCPAIRALFSGRFPGGPTPAQRLAGRRSPRGENLLLVSPTGTGKTLAAFLAILDRLYPRARAPGRSTPGLRCVYVSPLRSLGYDIERNLAEPLEAIRRAARARPEPGHASACGRATPRPTTAGSSATTRRTC